MIMSLLALVFKPVNWLCAISNLATNVIEGYNNSDLKIRVTTLHLTGVNVCICIHLE